MENIIKKLFIKSSDFNDFIKNLISKNTVYGPVAKRKRFIFDEIKNVEQLRLDYDTTILPPKKYFFLQNKIYFNLKMEKASLVSILKKKYYLAYILMILKLFTWLMFSFRINTKI